jgi:hypothetical protein
MLVLLLQAYSATATGQKAFYSLFEPMLRNPNEWPASYERFRDGVIVLDPYNATAKTVMEVKQALNATVLMYWDTNDILLRDTGGKCLENAPDCNPTDGRFCSTGHVKCCNSFNCSYKKAPQCGPDVFPSTLSQIFDRSWAVRLLPENGSIPIPQCLYFFGLSYVPFEKSVQAIGTFLSKWIREKGFDGLYLDEYFPLDVFERVFTSKTGGFFSNLTLDTDGDGKQDTPQEITAQYSKWRNALTAMLRKELGPSAVLIANTAGAGADAALNGITLEMEACVDAAKCKGWFKEQEQIGAKPPMSVIWTCNIESMPEKQQCQNAAQFQAEMPWVQVGSAWYDGPRVLCD